MVCTNCGNNMPDDARFCAVCGVPFAYILDGDSVCSADFRDKSPDSFMALEEYPSENSSSGVTEPLSDEDRDRLMSVIAQKAPTAPEEVTALSDAEVMDMMDEINFE